MTLAKAILAAGLLAAVSLLAGWALAGTGDASEGVPGEGSVDAGFARDMQTHHAQAVDMALLVRDRTDDETIRTLALDILLTQQQQRGQMFGWLAGWGLPQSSTEPAMAWMGMAGMPMMGLASDAAVDRLAAAEGREAERIFLDLMIAHHQGGIQMAEYAETNAEQPEIRHLASTMTASQANEIQAMQDLLDDRAGSSS